MDYEALPQGENMAPVQESPRGRRVGVVVALVLCLGAFAGYASFSQQATSAKPAQLSAFGGQELSKSSFVLTTTGEYDGDPGVHYPFIRSGRVVEPARDTVLTIKSSDADMMLAQCDWDFTTISGQGGVYAVKAPEMIENLVSTTDNSCSITTQFQTPGRYLLKVTVTTAKGEVLDLTEKLDCYYVRREIHSLSDKDWSRFLDTFQILSNTPTTDGQRMYGEWYRSLSYLAAIHLDNAGRKAYDHIHEGLGIVPQHIALTNEFERSMQSVTPAFSIPYWDYTIDEEQIHKLAEEGSDRYGGYSAIVNNKLFGEKYFGNVGMTGGLHAIANGRFAYQRVDTNESATVNSPYGYLRAPWNLNPSPFVTRYHEMCGVRPGSDFMWPSCATHFRAVYEIESFYALEWAVGLAPHGPVHVWLGGIGGGCLTWDKDEYPFSLLTETDFHYAQRYLFIMLKEGFRKGQFEFPKTCSIDDLTTDQIKTMLAGEPRDFDSGCRWVCTIKEDYADFINLLEVGGLTLTGLSPPEIHDLVEKIFCSESFWPGDHLEAASGVEASFYPIHPALDRLMQFRLLANPFEHGMGVWWNPDGTTLYCDADAACEGHHPGDLTSYQTIMRDDDGIYQMSYFTNAEVLNAINPTSGESYKAHYIYDHFEWSHCESQGFAFKF